MRNSTTPCTASIQLLPRDATSVCRLVYTQALCISKQVKNRLKARQGECQNTSRHSVVELFVRAPQTRSSKSEVGRMEEASPM